MNIELISTGNELMAGQVANTNQPWLCSQLAKIGLTVARLLVVPDNAAAIEQAVKEALVRADLVITTGGLGPTADDLTRDSIARLLGRKLYVDGWVLAAIEEFYIKRGRPVLERVKVQAQAPEGSLILPNAAGTAPGLAIEVATDAAGLGCRAGLLVMLPGPPRELYPMFTNHVVPLLLKKYPCAKSFVSRTLKTTGLGESAVEEILSEPLKPLVDEGLQLGYCARVGEVDIRLEASGENASELVAKAEPIVRSLLEPHIFGAGEDTLEAVIIKMLTDRNQTLALAESCTGGYLAHRLTNVPGASNVFLTSLVTYSNEAKQRLLGVPAAIIQSKGAVSEATARAMAEGARTRNSSDFALAITGIAGPGGGTPAKPVGTVFIALATQNQTRVERYLNCMDRKSFKRATAQQALELLRQTLLAS